MSFVRAVRLRVPSGGNGLLMEGLLLLDVTVEQFSTLLFPFSYILFYLGIAFLQLPNQDLPLVKL